ncbi:hypothetical protein [Aquibacillus kalidii]|uniref:hypothetical protein n=1 Tax=Aquibacillus kalidii TaxID=2762597 RepID=UPI001648E5F8|nr:hypothetical protein [Aquibacillus kalidii]
MNFDLTSISSDMPDFHNHEQAREWFKDQFENRFTLGDSTIINGKRTYYYHLIKDPEKYHQYMESFSKKDHDITNFHTFESYSTIEINEDGDISFSI